MSIKTVVFSTLCIIMLGLSATAQKAERIVQEQCGTMDRLQAKFERNPELKTRFEAQRTIFNDALKMAEVSGNLRTLANGSNQRTVYSIPVVFHVVLTNPNLVTDAQIAAQVDTLNRDFFGSNGDSVKIPSYFKPLFGKSGIQFCLAQRTPDGLATTGIDRVTTTQSSFSVNDAVKHSNSGGVDLWDNTKYFNVWLCQLSGGILGYATFPDDGIPNEQGVVIDYRSLPGGSLSGYNGGKSLTHETGHYFNLYHIWGDDDGACWGTDYVDDTPNQANSTSGCYSGIVKDSCTPGGNGIMYQNYMDYSSDNCLVMFTGGQVTRMESALMTYRASLLTSNGCQAPVARNYDAQLVSINQPDQRVCSATFTPSVTIKNRGSQTLNSLVITSVIDNVKKSTFNWTGSLAKLATATVALPTLVDSVGNHSLKVYVSLPDNQPDEDVSSDTISKTVQYYPAVTSVSESFEKATFPPAGWDVVNPDNALTWQRVTGVGKSGTGSVMVNNYNYTTVGQKDDLRLPNVNFSGVDSAFISFQVAAATYTSVSTANNVWDTLEVLLSTDCGQTYASLYKKYGANLVTRTSPSTTSFVPASTEWRKDSVNLTSYIGQPNVLLAFRNTTGYENNVYLDDINVRTVTINPNLKSQGFLVTPNPTHGAVAVQFYPQPTNLRAIQVYSLTGQKLYEINTSGQANNYYSIDMSSYAAGTYVVRAVFTDRVSMKKIIRL